MTKSKKKKRESWERWNNRPAKKYEDEWEISADFGGWFRDDSFFIEESKKAVAEAEKAEAAVAFIRENTLFKSMNGATLDTLDSVADALEEKRRRLCRFARKTSGRDNARLFSTRWLVIKDKMEPKRAVLANELYERYEALNAYSIAEYALSEAIHDVTLAKMDYIEWFVEELQRRKDGDDNDQNEKSKNIEQDSAGLEGAEAFHLLRRRASTV